MCGPFAATAAISLAIGSFVYEPTANVTRTLGY